MFASCGDNPNAWPLSRSALEYITQRLHREYGLSKGARFDAGRVGKRRCLQAEAATSNLTFGRYGLILETGRL